MDAMEIREDEQNSPSPQQKKRFNFKINRRDIARWFISNPLDTFLILLVLVGVVLTINPFPSVTGIDKIIRLLPAGMRVSAISGVQWIAYDGGAQISGSVFFVFGLGVGFLRVRQHAFKARSLRSNVCPNCKEENSLKRIHRTKRDRILNWISIPSRRYRCTKCDWKGLRLDENLV
ncbi:MAG: hypothetical protein AAF490_14920 [Chloroflexota bacterium]